MMKTHLLLVVVCVTILNTAVFSVVGGCGIFRAIPLALGWYVVNAIRGSFFADNHVRVVVVVSALLSACLLAGLLALTALIAKKKGKVSQPDLIKISALAVLVYVGLGLLPTPMGPCF